MIKYVRTHLRILASILFCFTFPASAAEVAVIVNKANPITSLSKTTVAKYFLKEIELWGHGVKIVPVDLVDTNPLASQFALNVLEMDLDKKRRIWLKKIYAGKSTPPQQLATDEAVITAVTAEPGAIGYISASNPTNKVKFITLH